MRKIDPNGIHNVQSRDQIAVGGGTNRSSCRTHRWPTIHVLICRDLLKRDKRQPENIKRKQALLWVVKRLPTASTQNGFWWPENIHSLGLTSMRNPTKMTFSHNYSMEYIDHCSLHLCSKWIENLITVTSYERHDVSNHRQFRSLFNGFFRLTTLERQHKSSAWLTFCEGILPWSSQQ